MNAIDIHIQNLEIILASLDSERELYSTMVETIRLVKAYKEGKVVRVDYIYDL
jgi:hypothetical protein